MLGLKLAGVRVSKQNPLWKVKYVLTDLYWMNMYVRAVALKIHSTISLWFWINPHFLLSKKEKCFDSNVKPSAAFKRVQYHDKAQERRSASKGKYPENKMEPGPRPRRVVYILELEFTKTCQILTKTLYIKAELYGQFVLFGIFGKIYIQDFFLW